MLADDDCVVGGKRRGTTAVVRGKGGGKTAAAGGEGDGGRRSPAENENYMRKSLACSWWQSVYRFLLGAGVREWRIVLRAERLVLRAGGVGVMSLRMEFGEFF